MKLCLLSLLLLGQTWEWTDSQGVTHFTDDRSTIPKGVKAKETLGDEVSTVTTPAPSKPVKASSPSRAGFDRCEQGKKRVAQLEETLAKAERDRALNEVAYRNNCGSLPSADQADCEGLLQRYRASKYPKAPPTFPAVTRTQAELDQAREALRKAQMDGC